MFIVPQDLGFSGLIRMTNPFSRLLRHARGCRGPILTRAHEIEGKSRYFRKIIAWTEKKSEEGITNSDIQKKRDIVNSKRWCSANEQIQPTFFLYCLWRRQLVFRLCTLTDIFAKHRVSSPLASEDSLLIDDKYHYFYWCIFLKVYSEYLRILVRIFPLHPPCMS